MRRLSGVLILWLGLQTSSAFAANCTFQPFTTVPGADVELQWGARSGRPCTLLLHITGSIGASRMLVARQAVHGVAATPTLSSISYVSQPGFVGHDSFVVDRTAEAMTPRVMRGTAHWTIDVDVTP
jgi:hypothetical protein